MWLQYRACTVLHMLLDTCCFGRSSGRCYAMGCLHLSNQPHGYTLASPCVWTVCSSFVVQGMVTRGLKWSPIDENAERHQRADPTGMRDGTVSRVYEVGAEVCVSLLTEATHTAPRGNAMAGRCSRLATCASKRAPRVASSNHSLHRPIAQVHRGACAAVRRSQNLRRGGARSRVDEQSWTQLIAGAHAPTATEGSSQTSKHGNRAAVPHIFLHRGPRCSAGPGGRTRCQ
jgi:hypothetical protein